MGRGEDGGLGGGKVRASRPARLYLQVHITPIICAHPPGTSPLTCASPEKFFLSCWNTGRCCRMWCLTVETSSLRTQYLVVERQKP